jgi:conjugation system TraG family ATPase
MPIHSIEDGFIVNKNGDITVGYRIFLPEAFTLSDNDAEHIHTGFENILRSLSPGTVFHQQTFVYTSRYELDEYSENYLYMSNLKGLKGTEMLNIYANIYITFTNNPDRRSPQSTSLLRKSVSPFMKTFHDVGKQISEIKIQLLGVESGFNSIESIAATRMTSADLNNALFDYINLSYNDPTADATKEVVQPMCLVTGTGTFKIGDKLVGIISLIEEGTYLDKLKLPKITKTELYPGITIPQNCGMMFSLVLGLPFDHIVNTVIEVTKTDDVVSALNFEKKSLNFLTNFYTPVSEKQNEITAFCKVLSENNYQTSYTAVNVIIHDHDLNTLSTKSALVKQSFTNINQSKAYIENEEVANLFFCSIPGNARSNYRGFVNITKQAICYLNKEGLYLSPKTGHIFHDRFGNPIRINLWANPLIDNRNKVVIGPSGSGKSYFLCNLILQNCIQGKDTVIIDIGGSYKHLIQVNQGKYFDSRQKEQFSFNPFLCQKDGLGQYNYDTTDEDGEGSDDLINTIATIIIHIWKKDKEATAVEEQLVKNSIKQFYEYVNKKSLFPNLTEYRNYLPSYYNTLKSSHQSLFNIEDIDLLLTPYTADGEYAYLLNGTENINIVDDTLIAYDMEEAKGKEYFPVIAILTLSVIIEKIKQRRGVPKSLTIDEALDFLTDKKFGDFIGYLYRTFRKKEGEVIIAAQNVSFIVHASPKVQQSILANADTKIILPHGEKNKDQVTALSVLGITNDEQGRIFNLQRGATWREFFIKMGNKSMIFRNGVSSETSVAFDSREETIVAIEKLYKERGSIPAAISEYLNRCCV